MDSMVSTALIIEREVDDARSIRDAGASNEKKGSQASSSGSGKKKRTSVPRGFQGWGLANRAKTRSELPVRLGR